LRFFFKGTSAIPIYVEYRIESSRFRLFGAIIARVNNLNKQNEDFSVLLSYRVQYVLLENSRKAMGAILKYAEGDVWLFQSFKLSALVSRLVAPVQ